MKRLLAVILTLASGMVLSAAAQSPAAPAAASGAPPAKVAVIAFQTAVVQTNEFKRNMAELQKKYGPQRQQLEALSNQIDTMSKQLQAQQATLSEAQRAAQASAIDAKKKQLDRDAQDAQSAFQQDMQDMFTATAKKVYGVMDGYVKQRGYTLVLDASQQQSPILYAADSTDITKAVLDAYNAKSGIPAPAAPAPQPARTVKPAVKPAVRH
jgi:outer membrane protein